MTAPSSQGPCICPEDAWRNDCPRHEHMQDTYRSYPYSFQVAEDAWLNGARPS